MRSQKAHRKQSETKWKQSETKEVYLVLRSKTRCPMRSQAAFLCLLKSLQADSNLLRSAKHLRETKRAACAEGKMAC